MTRRLQLMGIVLGVVLAGRGHAAVFDIPQAMEGPLLQATGASTLYVAGLDGRRPGLSRFDYDQQQLVLKHRFQLPAGQFQGFALATLQGPQGKREVPVMLAADGVYRMEGDQAKLLAGAESLFQSIDASQFADLSFVIDANRDGLSDFLVPGMSRQTLLVQDARGQFSAFPLAWPLHTRYVRHELQPAQLQISLPLAMTTVDINGDGLTELLLASHSGLYYFSQSASGGFAETAQPLSLPVALTEPEDIGRGSRAGIQHQFLALTDLNSDGLPDVLMERRQWQAAGDEPEIYTVAYFATRNAAGQLVFTGQRQASLKQQGETYTRGWADFNGDGLTDLYVISGELSASSVMGAFFSGGFPLRIAVYPLDAGLRYAQRPAATRETEFTVDTGSMQLGPRYQVADFNGDGKADLLLEDDHKTLVIYDGGGKRLLSKKGRKLKLARSLKGSQMNIVDLDRDSRAEILLRWPSPGGVTRVQHLSPPP